MNREISHEEAWASLDAAALDALEPNEREAVLAHASECESCREELETLRAVVSQLALATPSGGTPIEALTRVKARLVARAAADAEVRGMTAETRSPVPGRRATDQREFPARMISILAWRRAEWLALAASVLLIVGIGVLASVLRDRQNLRESFAAMSAHDRQAARAADSLRSLLMSRDSLVAGITGRDVAVVQLTSSATRQPMAMMFWDRTKNEWTFVAHNLPMPPSGRVYQLWLVTPRTKISAGTFVPSKGEVMMRATMTLSRDSVRAIAVTDEPAGGMPQPTGQTSMVGNLR
jgi:hypothetical protein